MSSDQRRHPRVPTDVPVVVKKGEGEHGGRLRDVSAGGAAIEFDPELGKSDVAFDIGEAIEMRPNGTDTVHGTVVRSYNEGVAMQFNELDEDLLERISTIAAETRDRR